MLLLLMIALTSLSAFYAGSEAAIFSQEISRLQRSTSDKFSAKLKKTLIGWLKRPERVITGLLLGNLIVNIGITNLGETWMTQEFGDIPHRHVILPIVITLYVLTFGEVIPKIVALVFKDTWVRTLQLPLRAWFRFANRITLPFEKLTAAMVRPLEPVKSELSERKLVEAVRFAEEHGLVKGEEMRMLSRSIAFYHNTIYATMIPRSQLLMLPSDSSVTQCKKAFSGSTHDFAAIYRKNSLDILGVVYLRGIVQLILRKKKEIDPKVHDVDFLPASMSLSSALSVLIEERRDLAAVVDEAGAFIGMITLRSITNHILGSSFASAPRDEFLLQIDQRRFTVSAQMPLDRFNEIFRTNFNAELSETIGGFILEKLDGFPHGDEELRMSGHLFRNFQVEDHKIKSFHLTVKKNA